MCVGASSNDSFVILLQGIFWAPSKHKGPSRTRWLTKLIMCNFAKTRPFLFCCCFLIFTQNFQLKELFLHCKANKEIIFLGMFFFVYFLLLLLVTLVISVDLHGSNSGESWTCLLFLNNQVQPKYIPTPFHTVAPKQLSLPALHPLNFLAHHH